MEDDAVIGRINARHRADRRARRVGAVHARHRHRALARFAIIDGDDAAAIDAPGHLVLILAGGDAGVAVDTAVRVAKEFHACHRFLLSGGPDLAKCGLRLLHPE